MSKKGKVNTRFMSFIPKVLVMTGIVIILISIAADWLGIGTSGFGFGSGQMAGMLVGLSLLAGSVILRLKHPFKKYVYSLILATILFLLWYFWLYPVSGYKLNFFHAATFTYKVLILSHIFILFLVGLSAGIAVYTIWNALNAPHRRKEFLDAHVLLFSEKKVQKVIFVSWILLWIVGALVVVEFVSRRLIVAQGGLGKRPLQPYFMNGDFYDAFPDEMMIAREGPGVYGYYEAGGIYVYGFDKKVTSIADRGDFLFQDRVDLANNTNCSEIIRIFVLGGSVAYGTGASSKETRWYVLLEQALSTAFDREVRLIPAAMGAYNSTQERLVLELMVLPKSPEGIIILDGYNDTLVAARPGDPYNQGALYKQFYSPFFGVKRWLANQSYLVRYLVNKSLQQTLEMNRQHILKNPELLANYTQSMASVYLDNLMRMLERCQDKDIPCIALLQPARVVTWRNLRVNKDLSSQDALTLAAYEEILKRINEPTFDIPIYDLTTAFDIPGAEKWFSDPVHFEDPGQKIIADFIYSTYLAIFRQISCSFLQKRDSRQNNSYRPNMVLQTIRTRSPDQILSSFGGSVDDSGKKGR